MKGILLGSTRVVATTLSLATVLELRLSSPVELF